MSERKAFDFILLTLFGGGLLISLVFEQQPYVQFGIWIVLIALVTLLLRRFYKRGKPPHDDDR
jgi:membrane protein implicated in regulation of membrane protease activity